EEVPADAEEGESPSVPTVTITLKSLGEMVMPAEVIVQFDDGEVEIRTYPVEAWATTRERSFTVERDGRSLRRVVVDRDDVLPDINPENNRWSADQ
ncbi:MAG: hypothetical protein ACFCBV_11900, partial [Phycisphaerales bacterium]